MLKYKIWIPSIITLLSAVLCLLALAQWPGVWSKPVLIFSLFLDACDGYVARKLKATTEFGATLDIRSDSALSVAIAWRCCGPSAALIITLILLLMHTFAGYYEKRISGRWILSIIALMM